MYKLTLELSDSFLRGTGAHSAGTIARKLDQCTHALGESQHHDTAEMALCSQVLVMVYTVCTVLTATTVQVPILGSKDPPRGLTSAAHGSRGSPQPSPAPEL